MFKLREIDATQVQHQEKEQQGVKEEWYKTFTPAAEARRLQ
jgi:hypothetical protein